ncbi:MAG: pilus assembly protein PilM [Myxococcales bacterium]|nr:pilus assembly protein PilM [Myxococcales bacterium]MCB9522124.1 pilus assembly protein PilM [Myxococcales bacterium]
MATKVVGLDLGAHTVKVCELVTAFRSFELVGFGSEAVEPVAEDQHHFHALAAAARRLLERRGLLNETLMTAMPPAVVSTALLDFPFSQPKKIEQVLPFQLDEAVPFDVEDLVYDYQIVEKSDAGPCKVLVAYVKEDTFQLFLAALSHEGLDPKVVSIGPLAWFNLHDQVVGEAVTAPVAVLDIGHTHSELAIFAGGHPQQARDFIGGGQDITQALAHAFKVPAEQAERGKIAEGRIGVSPASQDTQVDHDVTAEARQRLISDACRSALGPVVREVRRSLVAFEQSTGQAVELVYLTGGTSQLRGLTEYLARVLGVHVAPLDPLAASFNRLAGGGAELRPYAGKALALSLRAFSRAHQSQLNFRKGEYIYTGDFGFLRGRVISVAVAVLVMIILGALGAKTRERVLQAEYQGLANQASALSEVVLGYPSDDVDLLYSTVAAGVKNSSQIPESSAFETLQELSQRIDFNLKVDVDRVEIDLTRKKMTLEGKTESGGDVERIVDGLRKTRCYNTRVQKERVEKSVDDRTKFRISASSSCG